MTDNDRSAGHRLIEIGAGVPFRVLGHEVLPALDYRERDELSVSDFFEGLAFRRGELHFRADYIRGRRVKTDITVRSDGSVTVTTVGRGKAPFRWLDRLKGKKRCASLATSRRKFHRKTEEQASSAQSRARYFRSGLKTRVSL